MQQPTRVLLTLTLVVLVLLGALATASAATTTVTAGGSIQAAIDAAAPGDTILVEPGTYNESPIITKSLILKSTAGPDTTAIVLQPTPNYTGSLVLRGATVTLSGFTIRGFDAEGGGLASTNIYVDTPVETATITDNKVLVGQVGPGSNGDDGFGLITPYRLTGLTNQLTITGNTFMPLNGTARRAFMINPGVANVTFSKNYIGGQFTAVALTQAQQTLFEENTIIGEGAAGARSGGVGVWGYPDPTVWGHATFRRNDIRGVRVGITLYNGENCIIELNTFNDVGNAVLLTNANGAFNILTNRVYANNFDSCDAEAVKVVNTPDQALSAENNWWNDPSGPSTVGTGAGLPVSTKVTFDPWSMFRIHTTLTQVAVDDDWTGYTAGDLCVRENKHYVFGYNAFATIQQGVDAVAAEGTVYVAAGTYPEMVTITKPLSLLGAQAGVDPRNSGRTEGDPSESIITGGSVRTEGIFLKGTSSVRLTGVLVDGFEVHHATYANVRMDYVDNSTLRNLLVHHCTTNEGIKTKAACNALTLRQIVSHDNEGDGIELGGYGTNTNHLVEDCVFYNNNDRGVYLDYVADVTVRGCTSYGNKGTTGDWHQGGIITYQANGTTLENNTCYGNTGTGIYIYKENYAGTTSSVVTGNTCYDNIAGPASSPGDGIAVYLSHKITVGTATCYGNARYGIYAGTIGQYGDLGATEPCNQVTITGSDTHNNGIAGLAVSGVGMTACTVEHNAITANPTGALVHTGATATFHYNAITANTTYGVNNTTNVAVDATANWWGDATGPFHATLNALGQGNAVSNNVLFDPWYADAAMTTLESNKLVKNVTQQTFYSTIQAALNAATPGDVLQAKPGTYAEKVTIKKAVTLRGAQAGVPAPGRTGAESYINGCVVIDANVSNVTLDGFRVEPGAAVLGETAGIYCNNNAANVTVQNCIITGPDNFNPYQSGLVTSSSGSTNITVSNNAFSAWETAVYINPAGNNIVLTGNTVDNCKYTFRFISVQGLTVTGNTFTNSGGMQFRRGWIANPPSNTGVVFGNNTFAAVPAKWAWLGFVGVHDIGLTLDLSTCTFDGKLPANMTDAERFALADKIFDKVDVVTGTSSPYELGQGLGMILPGQLYVTPNSYYTPFTTAPSIQRGINAAQAGWTVNVAPGTYSEYLDVTKGITLRGANAGIHPAVGKHPTETVGTRGPETILPLKLYPKADNITVDGFKFTGTGGRLVDTYNDANNFHLANCIFADLANGSSTGVLQFGGGSHANATFEFNRFNNSGDTLYLGGPNFNNLTVQYNDFTGPGCGIFQTCSPISGFVLQQNYFTGGDTGINMGTLTAPQITGNEFNAMTYVGLQVGTHGGRITGNNFHDFTDTTLPGYAYGIDLFGGQWGTWTCSELEIDHNTSANNLQGINIRGGVGPDTNVHDNTLTGNRSAGVRIAASGGIAALSSICINNNTISGAAAAGDTGVLLSGVSGAEIDARNNTFSGVDEFFHLTNATNNVNAAGSTFAGKTDPQIEDMVFHKYDNPALGLVNWGDARIATQVAATNASGNTNGNVTLQATLTRQGTGAVMAYQPLVFTVDGAAAGTALTNTYGVATVTFSLTGITQGAHVIIARFAGDTDYQATAAAATLTVSSNAPTSLTISSATPSGSIKAGETVTYTVQASDGVNTWTVTEPISWVISANAGGSWAGNTYTAQKAGSWTVTAAYKGLSATRGLTVTHATYTTLTLSPATATKASGATATYTAIADDGFGNSEDVTATTNFAIVEANAGGQWNDNVYTCGKIGTWTVRGTLSAASISDDATLTVNTHGAVTGLTISPDNASKLPGGTITYTATANDAAGNTWDVTGTTAFSIVQANHAGSWAGSTYTCGAAGTWTVKGIYQTVNDTTTLTVEGHGTAVSLKLSPANTTATAGTATTYTVTATDAAGNSWNATADVTLFSTPTAAGGSWADNTYTAGKAGTWNVQATCYGLTAKTTLIVTRGAATQLVVAPKTSTVKAGTSIFFTAIATDAGGNTWDVSTDAGTDWTTTDTAAAPFTNGTSGAAAGKKVYVAHTANQTATIAATYQGCSDDAAVTVTLGNPVAIDLTLTPASLQVGETMDGKAMARDAMGNTWNVSTAANTSWYPSANASATLANGTNAAGDAVKQITTPKPGTWTIQVMYQGLTQTASYEVSYGAPVSIEISPLTKTVTAGDAVTFTATAVDAAGHRWDVSTATGTTWTVTGDVDAGAAKNVFITKTAGEVRVTASNGGQTSAEAVVTVLPVGGANAESMLEFSWNGGAPQFLLGGHALTLGTNLVTIGATTGQLEVVVNKTGTTMTAVITRYIDGTTIAAVPANTLLCKWLLSKGALYTLTQTSTLMTGTNTATYYQSFNQTSIDNGWKDGLFVLTHGYDVEKNIIVLGNKASSL